MKPVFKRNLDICLCAVTFVLALPLILYSCTRSLDADVKQMYARKVSVPYGKMDKRSCSIYAKKDRTQSSLVLLLYIDEKDCTSCEVSRLSRMEKAYIDEYSDVEFVYVVHVKRNESEFMYRKLCDARVEGTVYLDTCNAFLSSNTGFPSSPLLHTLVMDRKGNVLLVGNPFNGVKIKSMFDKIVEEKRNVNVQ